MNPTVGQPLEFNRHHWTRADVREKAGAEWVEEHKFAGEDWNFDLSQECGGHLYGYGQGKIGLARVQQSSRFDVVFYVRDREGVFRAAGLYLDAEYLTDETRDTAWDMLISSGIVDRRIADLRAAFDGEPEAEAEVSTFCREKPIRWKVAARNVFVFRDLPAIRPLRETDYRHKNAYDWSEHPWEGLFAGPTPVDDCEFDESGVDEGRVVLRVHRTRERSKAFRDAAVARRRQASADGRVACEACGFDFGRTYGSRMEDFIECHHTKPLAATAGARTYTIDEIALLCANCHRAAHRAEALTLPSLRHLLREAASKTS